MIRQLAFIFVLLLSGTLYAQDTDSKVSDNEHRRKACNG